MHDDQLASHAALFPTFPLIHVYNKDHPEQYVLNPQIFLNALQYCPFGILVMGAVWGSRHHALCRCSLLIVL